MSTNPQNKSQGVVPEPRQSQRRCRFARFGPVLRAVARRLLNSNWSSWPPRRKRARRVPRRSAPKSERPAESCRLEASDSSREGHRCSFLLGPSRRAGVVCRSWFPDRRSSTHLRSCISVHTANRTQRFAVLNTPACHSSPVHAVGLLVSTKPHPVSLMKSSQNCQGSAASATRGPESGPT